MQSDELPTLTDEEKQAIAAFLNELAGGVTCPHCHQPIEKRKQVGRCVYALPCNHRLYEGRLPKEER
jgi:hypothetical protein